MFGGLGLFGRSLALQKSHYTKDYHPEEETLEDYPLRRIPSQCNSFLRIQRSQQSSQILNFSLHQGLKGAT